MVKSVTSVYAFMPRTWHLLDDVMAALKASGLKKRPEMIYKRNAAKCKYSDEAWNIVMAQRRQELLETTPLQRRLLLEKFFVHPNVISRNETADPSQFSTDYLIVRRLIEDFFDNAPPGFRRRFHKKTMSYMDECIVRYGTPGAAYTVIEAYVLQRLPIW